MNTINLQSENFKENLINLINSSNLPISNVYFIFQLVGKEIEDAYNHTIEEEKMALIENQQQKDLTEKDELNKENEE